MRCAYSEAEMQWYIVASVLTSSQVQLENLPSMLASVWTDDVNRQLEATRSVLKISSIERSPPIQEGEIDAAPDSAEGWRDDDHHHHKTTSHGNGKAWKYINKVASKDRKRAKDEAVRKHEDMVAGNAAEHLQAKQQGGNLVNLMRCR